MAKQKITIARAIESLHDACDCQELDDDRHHELADAIHDIIVDAVRQHPALRGVPRVEVELTIADARNRIARMLRGQFDLSKQMLIQDFMEIVNDSDAASAPATSTRDNAQNNPIGKL